MGLGKLFASGDIVNLKVLSTVDGLLLVVMSPQKNVNVLTGKMVK